MDTKTLEKFCPWARNRLMEAVDLRCRRYGLTDDARAANPADSDVVNGTVLTAAEKSQRATLYARIEECGYTHFLEEMAYTWFNRFAAIRYMELHDYLPSRVRMLSCAADGSFRPDCLRVASEIELPGLDKARVLDFMDAADDEGLFRLILLAQCNELADALPEVFGHLGAADELMLPDGLLRTGENDVLYHLVTDISEETWQDVEVLGWMYQFYNSERKDDFFKSKRKASADDLAPATQLFTPKWIVQYLVENSLGRLWMLNNPSSHLKDQMKYFIAPDDEHEDFIRINGPEDITFCDPACGSGHILSYAFELLYAMYEERGYRPSEIPELILEKNLTGFEIDERAAQIASLVLAMRAREHDRRFLKRDVTARIHVFQSVDCEGADLPKSVSEQLEHLGEIGSLVKLTEKDLGSIHDLGQQAGASLLDSKLAESLRAIEPVLHAISNRYDVVVANPPYMGSSSFNPFMSSWIKKNYPDVKSDLCTCFIERNVSLAKDMGYASVITSDTCMYLSSFTSMREKIIDHYSIIALIDTRGTNAHPDVFDANAGWVISVRKTKGFLSSFYKLNQKIGSKDEALETAISNPTCGWFYRADASTFHDIPGTPIAYWASTGMFNAFRMGGNISNYFDAVVKGIFTGDNARFLRLWHEVSISDLGTTSWALYAKGGSFRRWYGNTEHVVDWKNDASSLKNYPGSGLAPAKYFGRNTITWSKITSSLSSFRINDGRVFFDDASPALVIDSRQPDDIDYYILGLLNSVVIREMLSFISPTLNCQVGDVLSLPVIETDDFRVEAISRIVMCNVSLSRTDWDSLESSVEFIRSPLV
ncbi:MAG TPA: BREX-1 system adenine-specific DNA-methyltransferase PglX [Candidatus Olsenella stercoravium]|uniref:site-specific DNA-methyltransferase (adenine-specific) n=1 Tax=Candidatus Olsenella stercoravium TaxID=2838713 RepID=A0A9D2IQI3_9ACTN|nr:BREX-1 system adenine-specific DNA-methyltransferase PglX [Candidatus Olsenella stercoravium]